MKTELTEYDIQAKDFLNKTNTEFKVEFLRFDKYFDSDKEKRDIYSITLTRGSRTYTFEFGQSINCSQQWHAKSVYAKNLCANANHPRLMGNGFSEMLGKSLKMFGAGVINNDFVKNENYSEPTEYDVLARLTKYDVGTFEDFCHEFGYDTDSRSAEKTYKAILNEWHNVAMLWNNEEIEELQEIQ